MLDVNAIVVFKMTSHCAGTVQITERRDRKGIRK